MMALFDELVASIDATWSWIGRAPHSWRHPMRAPTCITGGPDGPRGRTMILREVLDESLIFFTDARSPKVLALRSNPRVRCMGMMENVSFRSSFWVFQPIVDHPRLATWRDRGLKRFEDYGSPDVPGQPLSTPKALATLERAREQFLVLAFVPQTIEYLQLSSQGHRRAEWSVQSGVWTLRHLVP